MTGTFVICHNEDEINSNKSCYGNQEFEISTAELIALFQGETLAAMVNDEYGMFIKLNTTED